MHAGGGKRRYGADRHRGTALCVACAATPRLRGDQAWPTGQGRCGSLGGPHGYGESAEKSVQSACAVARTHRDDERRAAPLPTGPTSWLSRSCIGLANSGELLPRYQKKKREEGTERGKCGIESKRVPFENAHAVDKAQAADDWARLTRRVHERRPQTEAALTTPPTPQRST